MDLYKCCKHHDDDDDVDWHFICCENRKVSNFGYAPCSVHHATCAMCIQWTHETRFNNRKIYLCFFGIIFSAHQTNKCIRYSRATAGLYYILPIYLYERRDCVLTTQKTY